MINYKGVEFPYIYMEDKNGNSSILLIIDENISKIFDHDLDNFIFKYDKVFCHTKLKTKGLNLTNFKSNLYRNRKLNYCYYNTYFNLNIKNGFKKFIYNYKNIKIMDAYNYIDNFNLRIKMGHKLSIIHFNKYKEIKIVFNDKIPLIKELHRNIKRDKILNNGDYSLTFNNQWMEDIEYQNIYTLGLSLINQYSFDHMVLHHGSISYRNLHFGNKNTFTLLEILPLLFHNGCMFIGGKLNGFIDRRFDIYKNNKKINEKSIKITFNKLYKKYNKI